MDKVIIGLLVGILILLIVLLVSTLLNKNLFDSKVEEIVKRENDTTQSMINNTLQTISYNTNGRIDTMTEAIHSISENNYKAQMEMSKTIMSTLNDNITSLQSSNEKRLDEIRKTVDEKMTETLNKNLSEQFRTVSEQLSSLYKSLGEMKELSNGVTNNVSQLNRVLTNVKSRGTWAEVHLQNILDDVIPGMYITNYSPVDNSRDVVEFAVKLPNASGDIIYLPLDSKLPLEDYIRLCDAVDNTDVAGIERERKNLEQRVLDEARSVRKYISVPKTTPYAIMYLATEGLYAEIMNSKSGIAEKIQAQYNVLIAGPSTINALLSSLAMGFKAIAINKKAEEVRKILEATKMQYGKFTEALAKVRRQFDLAGSALDDAEKRNEIINKNLKAIGSTTEEEANKLLGLTND